MKKLLVLALLPFLGCAPTKTPNFDTTEWAKMGDTAFSVDTVPDPAKFKPFEDLDEVQTRITYTNLTIRQRILWAAVDKKGGLRFQNDKEAKKQFGSLTRDGYWSEGFSYFQYVRAPMLWYTRVTGDTIVTPADLSYIWNGYAALADPAGNLPLPEVAEGVGFPPRWDREWNTPSYYVRRWFSGDTLTAYILIAKSARIHPPLNLHHHLEAGYFALWIRGRYVVRCKPYTGWANSDPVKEDGFYNLLPKGAVIPNAWRLKPPAIIVERHARGYKFTWDNGGRPATRQISLSDTSVTVSDTWGRWGSKSRSWRL